MDIRQERIKQYRQHPILNDLLVLFPGAPVRDLQRQSLHADQEPLYLHTVRCSGTSETTKHEHSLNIKSLPLPQEAKNTFANKFSLEKMEKRSSL